MNQENTAWQPGDAISDRYKEIILKEAKLVTFRNAGSAFLYFIVFVIPAVHMGLTENSWYFFAATLVFAFIGFCCVRNGLKRLARIKENRFQWRIDTVKEREWGGRASHSRVYGESQIGYYTQHLLFTYAKESRIIGVRFRKEDMKLGDQLTCLYDPLAYKIKNNIY